MYLTYWEQTTFFNHKDVVIAGAGLMGLWIALELKKLSPSMNICIVEKHPLPTGASTRNAGFACFGSPGELLSDAESLGVDDMLLIAEKRFRGIHKIRKTFGDTEVGYDPCGGYEVFEPGNPISAKVQAGLEALNRQLKQVTGTSNCFQWASHKLSAQQLTGFDCMVENTLEAGLHSGKLVNALLGKCASEGIQVMLNNSLLSWQANSGSIQVNTTNGRLSCTRLVLATNAFTNQLCVSPNIRPARGQVLVTNPIPGLKLHGTFHYDDGFYYFRNIDNRVLIGGARNKDIENETTTSFDTTELIQDELQRFLQHHILKDKHFEIEYKWSGIMGFTDDKRPVVKTVDHNVIAVSACNGMGVALSPIIAGEVASLTNQL